MSKADVLAFGAHPDDAEIACGGTLIKMVDEGAAVIVVDLTRGERGTRGDAATREREAARSTELLGLHGRETLTLNDTAIDTSPESRLQVIRAIRRWRPSLVILPHAEDRHPDHMNASRLIYEACFYAGLDRIDTGQPAYRPRRLIYSMGWHAFTPTFIVDVTKQAERKLQAIYTYASQFSADACMGPPTQLTSPTTDALLRSRMAFLGASIGVQYGEGFLVKSPLQFHTPLDALFDTF